MNNDTPIQLPPPPEDLLLALAKREFGEKNLTKTDENFFTHVAQGKALDVTSGNKSFDSPANADNWPPERTLKADRIAWLCTNTQAKALVPTSGIQLIGFKIEGNLECSNIQVNFPLWLEKCSFKNDIKLRFSRIDSVSLEGSHCKAIDAVAINVKGGMLLNNGFTSTGQVTVGAGKIGASLDCNNAQFLYNVKDAYALNAASIHVVDNVFMKERFKAGGRVNFCGATVGGDFDCRKSTFNFDCDEEYSLNADSIKVGKNVSLSDNFCALGQVSLRGATIGGLLDCNDSNFGYSGKKGYSLNADAINVERDIFLRNKFKACGQVNLCGAAIGGQLDCSGAHFMHSGEGGYALNLESISVGKDIFLRDYFIAKGRVNLTNAVISQTLMLSNIDPDPKMTLCLRSASVGVLQDDEKSWPVSGGLDLHGFEYRTIDKRSPVYAPTRKKWLRLQPDGNKESPVCMEIEQLFKDSYDFESIFQKVSFLLRTNVFSKKSFKTIKCIFQKNVYFNQLIYLLNKDEFDPQPYEQLASVLKKMGHKEDAINISIEKERERARFYKQDKPDGFKHKEPDSSQDQSPSQSRYNWNTFKDLFFWWWRCRWDELYENMVCFGYRPFRRTLPRLFILLLIGWGVYEWAFQQGIMMPTHKHADTTMNYQGLQWDYQEDKATPENVYIEQKLYPSFQAFFYSADALIPIIQFGQTDYWQPNVFYKSGKPWGYWRFSKGGVILFFTYVQIIAGWILTTFIVAGIAGLVRKEDT